MSHDNYSHNYTSKGNSVNHWSRDWLNGKWKCFYCGTIIGKNLRGHSPQLEVCAHAQACENREHQRRVHKL